MASAFFRNQTNVQIFADQILEEFGLLKVIFKQ
jgi:hypothetical protein